MEKFLNVPVYSLVTTGTSVTAVGSASLTVSDSSLANVAVGDIVHVDAAGINKYFLVSSLIDENNVVLKPLDGGTVPVAADLDFFVHSGTVNNGQLVSGSGVLLVEQTSTSTVAITYDAAAATDVVTLTHTPVPSGGEDVRDLIEDAIVKGYSSSWTEISHEGSVLPYKVIGVSIG